MRRDGDDGIVEVEFTAIDDLGEHVSGTATLSLPAARVSGLAGRAALVGIGQTEFSKESGRSELQLACEAVSAALDDAGLAPADVDGLVTFTLDNNEEMEVARSVGIQDLSMFARIAYGGGAAAGDRDAGRDGGRDRRRRGGRLLPRDERAVGAAVRELRRAR